MIYTTVFRDCCTNEIGTIMIKCVPYLVRKDFKRFYAELEHACALTNFKHPIEAYVFSTILKSTTDMILYNRMFACADVVLRYTPEEVFDDGEYVVYGHIYSDCKEIRTTGIRCRRSYIF